MKKFLKSILSAAALAALSAMIFAGCSSAVSEDQTASVSADSRAAEVITISSDLNPGFGKAVYFTGDFREGNNWTTAVRGTYDNGKWICNVNDYDKSFEYKALVGDWNEGEVVNAEFTNLKKLGKASELPGYQGMPAGYFVYSAENISYGNAVYFYFENAKYPYAIRGCYKDGYDIGYCPTIYNSWFLNDYPSFYAQVVAYEGSYDLGETVTPVFKNLTWEEGANHLYK